MSSLAENLRMKNLRSIKERIHISGRLVLETPAHFGGGESLDDFHGDMTLIRDEVDGRALIPGTTLAGALRNYLRERLHGYSGDEEIGKDTQKNSPIAWLFGPARGSDTYHKQSLLITEDALSVEKTEAVVLRDGVRIDPQTGTAYVESQKTADGRFLTAGAKFDAELLEAGTCFDLHFDLLITESRSADQLLPFVAAMLEGLGNGDIRLGLRKRRGFGRCSVGQWTVSRYDLTDPAELCLWLGTPTLSHRPDAKTGTIVNALGLESGDLKDERKHCTIDACFSLEKSSILIRSGFGQADIGPDAEHLHARQADGEKRPVISGTSWAGVMRHRALRIANTIAMHQGLPEADPDDNKALAPGLVNELFGYMPDHADGERRSTIQNPLIGKASRLIADETVIKNGQTLYQTRVRIDRFTGGAYDTGLYEQAPVYGKKDTTVDFGLKIREPKRYEIGLILLVLKDLWTGDLTVGGESSVGRGRLTGVEATVQLPDALLFKFDNKAEGLGLDTEQQKELQKYVCALWEHLSVDNSVDNKEVVAV